MVDEPLEQYVTFWHRPHLFKLEPVGRSASALLQTMQARGSAAGVGESAIAVQQLSTLQRANLGTRKPKYQIIGIYGPGE